MNMDPFEDLILFDIDEEVTTELEQEILYNEGLFDDGGEL